jgi:hypothetical protein
VPLKFDVDSASVATAGNLRLDPNFRNQKQGHLPRLSAVAIKMPIADIP